MLAPFQAEPRANADEIVGVGCRQRQIHRVDDVAANAALCMAGDTE